jgi:hypothetical protein
MKRKEKKEEKKRKEERKREKEKREREKERKKEREKGLLLLLFFFLMEGLAVPAELDRVVLLPVLAARRADKLVVAVALARALVRAAGGRLGAELPVLHRGPAHPVDAGVVADDGVHGVHHDDLVELVRRVLSDPVRVEDAEGAALAADALLGDGAVRALELEVVDALVDGLAVGAALSRSGAALAAAALDADAVDDEALLGLVAEAAGLVGPRGARGAVDRAELAVVPHAHAVQKAQHVRLLALVQLLQVLVGSHDEMKRKEEKKRKEERKREKEKREREKERKREREKERKRERKKERKGCCCCCSFF